MANRTMQAKSLKAIRQRRRLPKTFKHVYFREGVDKDAQEPRERDDSYHPESVQYRARAKGLKVTDDLAEMNTRFSNTPPGRAQAEAHMRRIREAVPQMLFFEVHRPNSARRTRIFFNSEHTLYILLEETQHFIRSSRSYASRDSVVYHWKKDTIKWVEIKTNPVRKVLAPPLADG